MGEKMSKIKGIIIPVDWDEKGNVVAVALSTHDEKEYMINRTGKGDELRALIREEVEVLGQVGQKGGRRMITVQEYSLKKVLDQMAFS